MANPFLNTLQALGLYKSLGATPTPMVGFDGLPPEMVQAARAQAITGIGGQLLSGAMAHSPQGRAAAMAGLADAGDMSKPLYNMAQAKLMANPRPRAGSTKIIKVIGDDGLPHQMLVDAYTGEMIQDLGTAPQTGGMGADGQPRTSLQPFFVDTPQGRKAMVLDNRGGSHEVPMPEGYTVVDPAQMAGEKKQNALQAQAGLDVPKAEYNITQMKKEILGILQDPGLATATGETQGFLPDAVFGVGASVLPSGLGGKASSEALGARKKLAQLVGRTFMVGYDAIRGAGQISDAEGSKVTDAYARLQTAQSDQDVRDALTDLYNGMEELRAIVRAKAGKYAPPEQAQPGQGQGQPQPQPQAQQPQAQPQGGMPRVSSAQDYANLPSGTQYVDPNGVVRTKR